MFCRMIKRIGMRALKLFVEGSLGHMAELSPYNAVRSFGTGKCVRDSCRLDVQSLSMKATGTKTHTQDGDGVSPHVLVIRGGRLARALLTAVIRASVNSIANQLRYINITSKYKQNSQSTSIARRRLVSALKKKSTADGYASSPACFICCFYVPKFAIMSKLQ